VKIECATPCSKAIAASCRLLGKALVLAFLLLSFSVTMPVSGVARTRPGLISPRPDRGYVSALAAANRFLQAWQNQDHETGLLMLTDAAKQRSSEDRLEVFFTSGLDAAYEIARGRKMKDGRYSFPVTLFPSQKDTAKPDRPQKSKMVVVQAGKNEWAIDRLP